MVGQEEQGPLHGHVPVPMGEAAEQTGLQKRGEGLVFAFLNIAASGTPILGGAFSELRNYKMQRLMEKRIADLTESLRKEMQAVGASAIDEEVLRSEAFFDLLLRAVDTAARTRDRRKIGLVAQILRWAATQGPMGGYSAEEYLSLVSDLTALELEVALSLYRAQPKAGEPWDRWGERVCGDLGIDKDDLPMMLSRIEARGLIGRVVLMGDGDDLVFPEGPYYKVGPSFARLISFLGR